ncbi:MAG: PTS sugar transporter subunit IIA [Deltaproteobacteria bacterium]|nr:PTS sugar transporter subunit IIA [Deltaproteobacteria bacterium]
MHELAVYLHLDEATVTRLVSAGKIPSVQVDRQWRFKRASIDQWIEEQLVGDDENFADVPDGMKLPLEDLLPDQAIIPTLRSRTPVGVIEELAARAYTNGWLLDKPWFVGAVVERESLSSTAMEGGVAFLHTRAKDKGKIGRPFVIVGRSWEGIMFGAPDSNPTYLFFLLGLKYDRLHLPILGRLARALRNPATIAKLRALSSPDQVRALLLKEDAEVRAGRIDHIQESSAFQPKLDRQLRLRAIRRLQAQKAAEVTTAEKRAAALLGPKKSKPKKKAAPRGPVTAPRGPVTPPSSSRGPITTKAPAAPVAPAKPAAAAKAPVSAAMTKTVPAKATAPAKPSKPVARPVARPTSKR